MSTTTPDSFDAASMTPAMIGTWSYPAPEEPSGLGEEIPDWFQKALASSLSRP
jgi:hypothetical protein